MRSNPDHAASVFTRRKFLQRSAAAAAFMPCLSFAAAAPTPGSEEERLRIEPAIPAKAPAAPRRSRKLLIFTLNVNYGGHPSIKTANTAFKLMGEKTGAYQTVISQDPAIFKPASLKQFDAVFFNNNVGNLFTDPELRESLVSFVYGGGGMLGVHGSTVAFTQWPGAVEDWPEFGVMIGGRGANHRDSTEHVFAKMDDPAHPLNQPFGEKQFEYRDELFRVHGPYSRQRLRILFSIDTQKSPQDGQARGNCFREDNDYALAWVRQYGRGRVFYSTIAHNPYVFWDPKMLQFYLGAVQFALGDLPCPTIPSARVTPALDAQERLGWRLGLSWEVFPQYTLLELINKAAELGLLYVSWSDMQGIARLGDMASGSRQDHNTQREIRLALDAAGVRLLTYHINKLPGDPSSLREFFELGRNLGIETFTGQPLPEHLPQIDKLCEEFDIRFAVYARNEKTAGQYAPNKVVTLLENRSQRIGVCGSVSSWARAGIDPIQAVNQLKDRLLALQVHDLDQNTPAGREVVWGAGSTKLPDLLKGIRRLRIQPTMFGVDYRAMGDSFGSDINNSIKFFNQQTIQLARES